MRLISWTQPRRSETLLTLIGSTSLKITSSGSMMAGWLTGSVCMGMFLVWVPDLESLQRDKSPNPPDVNHKQILVLKSGDTLHGL
jgi:hypothetical protein